MSIICGDPSSINLYKTYANEIDVEKTGVDAINKFYKTLDWSLL